MSLFLEFRLSCLRPPPYESLYKTTSLPFLYPTATQIFETVIRFLAEGAASGLNVIAVYVTEILRVTGFDGTCQDLSFVCMSV